METEVITIIYISDQNKTNKRYRAMKIIIFIIPFLLLSLTPISNQWLRVVADNVIVREKPNSSSKIITKLNSANLVKYIHRSEKIGLDEGDWLFIDTQTANHDFSDTLKGWVLSKFIADRNMFEKINKFRSIKFDYFIGDTHLQYLFLKNGTYQRIKTNTYKKPNEEVRSDGFLYQYKNIIILKNLKNVEEDCFFVNENNKLCNQLRGDDDKPMYCSSAE